MEKRAEAKAANDDCETSEAMRAEGCVNFKGA
jgi:hypothetical protein